MRPLDYEKSVLTSRPEKYANSCKSGNGISRNTSLVSFFSFLLPLLSSRLLPFPFFLFLPSFCPLSIFLYFLSPLLFLHFSFSSSTSISLFFWLWLSSSFCLSILSFSFPLSILTSFPVFLSSSYIFYFFLVLPFCSNLPRILFLVFPSS